MKKFYGQNVVDKMVNFYDSLSEKDRRRYAAIEADKLPYGGQKYISMILGCDEKTIQQGLADLNREDELKKSE
jgi:hypothetical protein